MLVEQLEALQSIQETYVAMNESTHDLSNVKTDTLTSLHALHAKEPKGTRSYDQRQRVAAELKKRGIKVQEDVMDESAGPTKLNIKKILAKYPELADYGLKTAVWFKGELHTTSDHSIAPAGISDEKILAAAGVKVQEDVMDEKFAHPNHKKLDANGNGKLDAQDFALLRAKKKGMKNFKEFKESLEQLDELSKKTLSSYIKNANTSAINTGMEVGFHTGSGGKSDSKFKQDQMDKLSKHQKGIHTAINKLTKEDIDALGLDEEQLDELSKKTLGSYITKASMNRGHHGIDVGHYPLDSPKQLHHLNQMKKRQAGVKAAVRKLTKEDLDALGLDLDELM